MFYALFSHKVVREIPLYLLPCPTFCFRYPLGGGEVTVHAEGVYFPSLVASEQPGILQKSGDRPPETTTIVSPCHENVEKKS